ncbi:MAG: HAD family hydrolase [Candidatus Omnitrophica bacterium]|nr:HAD family hydrolase [Candidatus Omnitrophota bacterium]MCM8828293.1 HAD family hydrolase [Candidatus Omnitrophota bacterium]
MKKKLFIFDLDGTLIDAYISIWETLLHTLKTLGYPPVDFQTAKRAVGHGDKNYIPRFFKPDDVDKASKIYREYHLKSLNGKAKLLPGAKDLLEVLKQTQRNIAVASNRPSESGILLVRNLGIEHFFDKMMFGDQVTNQKPDPEILIKILVYFKIDRENAIFVGDMDIDAATGKKAGIDTFVVSTGSSTIEELKTSNPSRICNSLFEILEMLKQGLL